MTTKTKYKNEFSCPKCNKKAQINVDFREGQESKQVDFTCELCGQQLKFYLKRDLNFKEVENRKFPIFKAKQDDD